VENVATVVLALEAADVAEEVMHFLDRSGRARVVATASDDRQLAEAVRQLEPDVVVAEPSLASGESLRGRPLLALATRESVATLRAAIRSGAAGFFVWPGEREQLAAALATAVRRPEPGENQGAVVAVHGARGGAGTTFVATHLAAAFVRRGCSCVLIDADPVYGDVATALGAPNDGVRTLGDLAPLASEVTSTHLQDALWRHPSGLGVLLAPGPDEARTVSDTGLQAVIRAAATATDAVVLHLPRTVQGPWRAGAEGAGRILEILTLDVLSFRAASRWLDTMEPIAPDRLGFVVNRAARSELTAGDVARVFGAAPLAVLPFDRSVAKAQNHGRLLPPRGRMARAFDRLAARMVEPAQVGPESPS
jgi:pilus assembly protein CpaE